MDTLYDRWCKANAFMDEIGEMAGAVDFPTAYRMWKSRSRFSPEAFAAPDLSGGTCEVEMYETREEMALSLQARGISVPEEVHPIAPDMELFALTGGFEEDAP